MPAHQTHCTMKLALFKVLDFARRLRDGVKQLQRHAAAHADTTPILAPYIPVLVKLCEDMERATLKAALEQQASSSEADDGESGTSEV